MNHDNFQLCARLIPSTYVEQAENARRSQEHKIKILLEHVRQQYNIEAPCMFIVNIILTEISIWR